MATVQETERFCRDLEEIFGVRVCGGLFNALKKLSPVDQQLLKGYALSACNVVGGLIPGARE